MVLPMFYKYGIAFPEKIQWNPVNADTKGTGQIVRVNGVSVFYIYLYHGGSCKGRHAPITARHKAGSQNKIRGYMFSRRKDKGKRFHGHITLFNCTVTVTNANCELSD